LIRQITLKNFQAHAALTIDLSEFTGIVGQSSSGKTAILRALAWLFYGDWDPTYPNDPEKETAVAIRLEDGTVIGRFRRGKKNRAAVKMPDGTVLKYEDFGEHIPGVLDMLRLAPIKIGTREVNLNFSMQDDPIFMVTETGPTRAQWLGRLYGAHIINHMLRLMVTDKRRLESEKKTLEADSESLRSRVAGYKGLDSMQTNVSLARGLLERLSGMEGCRDDLSIVYREHEALRSKQGLLAADTVSIRIDLVNLEALEGLRKLRDEIRVAEVAVASKKHVLGLNPVEIRHDLDRLRTLQSVADELRSVESRSVVTKSGLKKASAAHAEALAGIKGHLFKDGKCPVCLSKPKKLDVAAAASRIQRLVGGMA